MTQLRLAIWGMTNWSFGKCQVLMLGGKAMPTDDRARVMPRSRLADEDLV